MDFFGEDLTQVAFIFMVAVAVGGVAFALLQPLVRDGLVRIEDRVVKATDAGRSVVRVIAAAFDPHTRADSARFSRAV